MIVPGADPETVAVRSTRLSGAFPLLGLADSETDKVGVDDALAALKGEVSWSGYVPKAKLEEKT